MNSHHLHSAKSEVRARLIDRRRQLSLDSVTQSDTLRTALLLPQLTQLSPAVVACYASMAGEPGTDQLLSELHQLGIKVLLPTLGQTMEPMWAWWQGPTRKLTKRGFLMSESPPLPSTIVAQTDVIIIPGLAGTPAGYRLGRGGGWYDRALRQAGERPRRWLLLHDWEILDHIPSDDWDEPVTDLVSENRWIVCGTEA